jgi:hypothetical protein
MTSTYLNRTWTAILSSQSPAGRCIEIKEAAPEGFVKLLGREHAPTSGELEALEWFDCGDAGDYGHIMRGDGEKKKNVL